MASRTFFLYTDMSACITNSNIYFYYFIIIITYYVMVRATANYKEVVMAGREMMAIGSAEFTV